MAVLEVTEPDQREREPSPRPPAGRVLDRAICARAPAIALSGGERRRVEIARCAGVPSRTTSCWTSRWPASIRSRSRDIRDLVSHLKDRGIGVLITDHNVRDTLDIVDRAYILHEGRVLARRHAGGDRPNDPAGPTRLPWRKVLALVSVPKWPYTQTPRSAPGADPGHDAAAPAGDQAAGTVESGAGAYVEDELEQQSLLLGARRPSGENSAERDGAVAEAGPSADGNPTACSTPRSSATASSCPTAKDSPLDADYDNIYTGSGAGEGSADFGEPYGQAHWRGGGGRGDFADERLRLSRRRCARPITLREHLGAAARHRGRRSDRADDRPADHRPDRRSRLCAAAISARWPSASAARSSWSKSRSEEAAAIRSARRLRPQSRRMPGAAAEGAATGSIRRCRRCSTISSCWPSTTARS